MTTFTAHGHWSLADWDLSSLAAASLQTQAADQFSLLAADGTLTTFGGSGFAHFGPMPRQGIIDHISVAGADGSFTLDGFGMDAADFRAFAMHGAIDRFERAIFSGNDTFQMGADFDASSRIDGGDGYDTVELDGDYAAGVVFDGNTMQNVEGMSLAKGHDYNLTLANENVKPHGMFYVDAHDLRATDNLTFDASGEIHGAINVNAGSGHDVISTGSGDDLVTGDGGRDVIDAGKGMDTVYGGDGNDTLSGGKDDDTVYGDEGDDKIIAGSGHDTLYGGAGDDDFFMRARFGMADTIDGGDGFDTIHLRGGDVSDFTFTAPMLTNIENVQLGGGHNYKINFDNTEPLGNHVKVDGSTLGASDVLNTDASGVTGPGMTIVGGAADDTIVGSAAGDIIEGGLGADTLTGGGGADTFTFANAADSNGSAMDTITDFDAATDVLDVANAVTGFNGTIAGLLSSLDGLTGLLGVSNLAAGHAILIQPILGALAGETLMIVDQNGVLGYQPGSDLLINLDNPVDLGAFGLDNFI